MSHKNAGLHQLALPSIGSLWEQRDSEGWPDRPPLEVALSQYAENGEPQVKFAPLPSEWISWEELRKNYRYIGKVSNKETQ